MWTWPPCEHAGMSNRPGKVLSQTSPTAMLPKHTRSHWAIGYFLMSNPFKRCYVICFPPPDALQAVSLLIKVQSKKTDSSHYESKQARERERQRERSEGESRLFVRCRQNIKSKYDASVESFPQYANWGFSRLACNADTFRCFDVSCRALQMSAAQMSVLYWISWS